MPAPTTTGRMPVGTEERVRQLGDATVYFQVARGKTRRPEDVLLDETTRIVRGGQEITGNELRDFLQDQFRRNGYNVIDGASLDLGPRIWMAVPRSGGEPYVVRDANTRVSGIERDKALSAYNGFVASMERLAGRPEGGTIVRQPTSEEQARAAALGMPAAEYDDFKERINSNPALRGMSVEAYIKLQDSVGNALSSIRETIRGGGPMGLEGDPKVAAAILSLRESLIRAAREAEGR